MPFVMEFKGSHRHHGSPALKAILTVKSKSCPHKLFL